MYGVKQTMTFKYCPACDCEVDAHDMSRSADCVEWLCPICSKLYEESPDINKAKLGDENE